MKIPESPPKGWKTRWEKEKLLVKSNFSFSHSVFKRLVLQTRKTQGLFGEGFRKNKDYFYFSLIFFCKLHPTTTTLHELTIFKYWFVH